MKKLLFPALLLIGCASYPTYIQVQPPAYPIPKGATEFTFAATLDQVAKVLSDNQIMYQRNENGISTEEFLIDGATRAQYRFYQFEDKIKCVPYWGVTGEVQAQVAMWAGMAAAQGTDQMARISYSYNNVHSRPETVFDYAVQLCSPLATLFFK